MRSTSLAVMAALTSATLAVTSEAMSAGILSLLSASIFSAW